MNFPALVLDWEAALIAVIFSFSSEIKLLRCGSLAFKLMKLLRNPPNIGKKWRACMLFTTVAPRPGNQESNYFNRSSTFQSLPQIDMSRRFYSTTSSIITVAFGTSPASVNVMSLFLNSLRGYVLITTKSDMTSKGSRLLLSMKSYSN